MPIMEKNPVRLPEVGDEVRSYGKLIAIQDVTPKDVILDYIFEDCEAVLEARINGKKVREYSTFNNFHGPQTCVPNAIKEAELIQRTYGESNLEFVVILKTTQVRMRPDPVCRENVRDREFRAMRQLDYGCRAGLPTTREEEVWSSLTGYKQSAAGGADGS